ncbi:MAG: methyltransferase domain-containing protein [Holophaga sp.]|nr:methyltransferase domain-containing protein [Holophaga sp.]
MSKPPQRPLRASLICPVRGCSEPLLWEPSRAVCTKGHLFDRAKSGYCNLLQVQERKAKHPGDSKAAVQARRRSLQRGLGEPLRDALCLQVAAWNLPPHAVVLDAGCGEGYYLDALRAQCALEGWGVDISTPAIDAAARAYPHTQWVVANADRTLPFADGCFNLITSITARKNPAEFHRLLTPGGHLLVVVAHEEDQKELRGALFGEAPDSDRAGATITTFEPFFKLQHEHIVTSRTRLDPMALKDLLLGSYRGERFSAQAALAQLQEQEVTLSYRLLSFQAVVPSQ